MLKQKHTLVKLREELKERKKKLVSVVKSLGTWPITAGTSVRRRRGN